MESNTCASTSDDSSERTMKRPGTGALGGNMYEIHVMIFFFTECFNKIRSGNLDKFYITSNVIGCGALDDCILYCQYPNRNPEIIFMQCKHKENPTKQPITFQDLLSVSANPFCLQKYFQAFLTIKKLFSEQSKANYKIFGNAQFQDCSFSIFTNNFTNFGEENNNLIVEEVVEGSFLHVLDNKFYHKLTLNGNKRKEIISCLVNSPDYLKIAKQLAVIISKNEEINFSKGLLNSYKYWFFKEVIDVKAIGQGRFKDDFVASPNHCLFKEALCTEIQKKQGSPVSMHDIVFKFRNNFGDEKKKTSLSCDPVTIEDIEEFIDKFVIFSGQPNFENLATITKEKLKTLYMVPQEEIDNKFPLIVNAVTEIWNKGGDNYLDETNSTIQDILPAPVMFNVIDPVPLFTERKVMCQLEAFIENSPNKITIIPQSTALCGLGGVGKTELARSYIQKNKHLFKNIVWINSENKSSLEKSFELLARDKLNMSLYNIDNEKKDLSIILDDLYKYLSLSKTLVVYDNAEWNTFFEFLPKQSNKNIYKLLTSRDEEWKVNMNFLVLKVFTLEEGREFLQKGLNPLCDKIDDPDTDKLLEELGSFPLALSQSIQYIICQRNFKDYHIKDYLEAFSRKKKLLLNYTRYRNLDNNYKETTFTTWKITFDEINNTKEHGKLAFRILNIIGYIAPQNIERQMFSGLVENEEDLLYAVSVLVKYSMVNSEDRQRVLSVHRLVQEVTQLEMQENGKEEQVLVDALHLFQGGVKEQTVNHAMCVWEKALAYRNLVERFANVFYGVLEVLAKGGRFKIGHEYGLTSLSVMETYFQENQIEILTTNYWLISMVYYWGRYSDAYTQVVELYEKAKSSLEENHSTLLLINRLLGQCLQKQAKYKEAMEKYQIILLEQKNTHVDTAHIIETKRCIGECLKDQGEFDKALLMYQEIYDDLCGIKEKEDPQLLKSVVNIGNCLRYLGKYDEALHYFLKVLSVQKDLHRHNHPDTLTIESSIGHCYLNQGLYKSARKQLSATLKSYSVVLSEDHPTTTSVKHNLGLCLLQLGDYDGALKLFRNILKLKIVVRGLNHPSTLKVDHCIGNCIMLKGKYNDALEIFRTTLKLKIEKLSESHHSTLKTKHKIAECLFHIEHYDTAIEEINYVISHRSETHPQTLIAKQLKAQCLIGQNHLKDALDLLDDILQIQQPLLPANSPAILDTLALMAKIHMEQGDKEKALNMFKSILEHQIDALTNEHPKALETKHSLGECLYRKEMFDEALDVFNETFKMQERILTSEHPSTLKTKQSIDKCYLKKGEISKSQNF